MAKYKLMITYLTCEDDEITEQINDLRSFLVYYWKLGFHDKRVRNHELFIGSYGTIITDLDKDVLLDIVKGYAEENDDDIDDYYLKEEES